MKSLEISHLQDPQNPNETACHRNAIHCYLSSDIRSSFWKYRTNMAAETLKGKGRAPSWSASVISKGKDWRLYGFNTDFPLPSELAAIRCPFMIEPWTKDTVPISYWGDAWHYVDGQIFEGTKTPVPWTGYWLHYEGKVVPVENFARVWFEIQKRDHIFEATRVTHHGMAFTHDPLPGIDLWALWGVEKENLLALIKESQGVIDLTNEDSSSDDEEQ